MRTLLIAYDLNRPGQDYTRLIERIKTFPGWCHPLESMWLIPVNATAAQMRDMLQALMDPTDELLVIEVENDGWASRGLLDNVNAWLRQHVAGG